MVNGDVWCDWDPGQAPGLGRTLPPGGAWLLLVDNPVQHPAGDFHLAADGLVHAQGEPRLTFAGIGVYHPSLFADVVRGTAAPLAPLLRQPRPAVWLRCARATRADGRTWARLNGWPTWTPSSTPWPVDVHIFHNIKVRNQACPRTQRPG